MGVALQGGGFASPNCRASSRVGVPVPRSAVASRNGGESALCGPAAAVPAVPGAGVRSIVWFRSLLGAGVVLSSNDMICSTPGLSPSVAFFADDAARPSERRRFTALLG